MAMAGISANRLELLQIADAVAREKSIERKIVIQAMEDAIQKAAKSRYGAENDIRCEIDTKTGETRLTRVQTVADPIENDATQISLTDAKKHKSDAAIGDVIVLESLPPLDFGRVAAQNAKQVIVQKVRDAERDRQFAEYKDRIGEITNGTVKRVEYGNVIVDLGRAEGIIRRDEMIPRENVRYGDTSAPISTTSAASSVDRRFSCPAPARNSCPSCSRWKYLRSTTTSSKSSRWPAIPAPAPRSR